MAVGDGKRYGEARRAKGGHQLNSWIAVQEHEHLKSRARERGMTLTSYLRELIRRDMTRNSDS